MSIPLQNNRGVVETAPAAPPPDWAARLTAFWFDGRGMADWYGGGPDFDEAVRDLAADWREALSSQPPEAFLADPDTALAGAILFDQVPRSEAHTSELQSLMRNSYAVLSLKKKTQ